jgi:hypothetical protein
MVAEVRTLLGLIAALVVGVGLAIGATAALVSTNAPDAKAAQQLKSGNVPQPNAVVYGQR